MNHSRGSWCKELLQRKKVGSKVSEPSKGRYIESGDQGELDDTFPVIF